MTQDRNDDATPQVDIGQSDHEREVARHEEKAGGNRPSSDENLDEGGRPTSGEDLVADRTSGDEGSSHGGVEDVVGDDMSSSGQNSDRLPQ
jgi:hypothetical protein